MEADILFNNALKKYNTWYKFIDKSNYNSDALDLFEKAKNKYYMDKKFDKVCECYNWMIKCANECTKGYSYNDIYRTYEDYAEFLLNKNIDIDKSIELYDIAINNYISQGRFNNISRIKEKIADYYHKKENYVEAIKFYLEVKELNTDNKYNFQKITKILFESFVLTNNYENAIQITDERIKNVTAITKYNLQNLVLDAMLCYIVYDKDIAAVKFKTYCDENPTITGSMQCNLINNIFNALENNKVDDFEYTVKKYDAVAPLSNIYIKLLTIIKENMSNESLL